MDADMAMHLSRARRDTVSQPGPGSSPTAIRRRSSEDRQPGFPPYNLQTDLEPSFPGRHQSDPQLGTHEEELYQHPVDSLDELDHRVASFPHSPHNHLNQAHDPSLLVSNQMNVGVDPIETEVDHSMGGLPLYQPNSFQLSRSRFEFSAMEDYVKEEKAKLGVSFAETEGNLRSSASPDAEGSRSTPFAIPPRRIRERKLSSSNATTTRRGKMALFEQSINAGAMSSLGGSSRTPNATHVSIPSPPDRSDPSSADHVPPLPIRSTSGGHDRPYRFSFYSNRLAATIHSRSLGELPAEGQSFEDLFSGSATANPGDALPVNGTPVPISGATTPRNNGKSDGPDFAPRTGFPVGGNRDGNTADSELMTWWLDITSPTDEEMKMLSKVFSIHPLTTEDIQMEETREKIELFRNYYFVCFRSFDQDPYSPTHLEPLNMYVVVFREGTLSFHFRPTPHPQNVRRRIKQLKDYINVTSDWISYALIDDITDAFGPLIQSIEYEVDSIDELVLILKDAEQSDMLRRIGTCRKKVMGLLRLMGNKADVVKGLAKRCNENWRVAPTSDIGLYLSDIQDHLITMTQNLNHYEKILSRSHSNYLAQISIEMTDANNQINDVLSKLTALGTVLIPMNLITGLWGMNVHVPGQDIEDGYAWFLSIIACLCAFAVIGGYSTYKLMAAR